MPFGTEKNRMTWLPDGKKISKISLFVLTECTNVTVTQTPHDDIGRACIASRGKYNKNLAIANRSHVSCFTQYVEGIYDNPVTLKSGLDVTKCH